MSVDMSKHFSTSALIRFTLPTIAMMIFTSCYTIVDGFFVSNYAGKTALAAVNLIFPAVMILASVGMMIGTGGSALVAKTLGEGDRPRARRHFSLLAEAEIPQHELGIPPVLLHLDPGLQVDLRPQELLHILPGHLAD